DLSERNQRVFVGTILGWAAIFHHLPEPRSRIREMRVQLDGGGIEAAVRRKVEQVVHGFARRKSPPQLVAEGLQWTDAEQYDLPLLIDVAGAREDHGHAARELGERLKLRAEGVLPGLLPDADRGLAHLRLHGFQLRLALR